MWRSFLAFLASLAAEPAVVDSEPPKAAAAVAVARSSMQKQQAAEEAADPPLVPVKRSKDGRFECDNGVCYWVDPETGKRYRVQNQ